MKRVLLTLALLIAPVLYGQAIDRAVLLAPTGTLYTVESTVNDSSSSITSTRYLTLTILSGQNVIKTNVPASISGGNSWQPELAFDSDSNTLFVFWLHSQNSILGASELLFCTFQNGRWNAASAIDDVPYHFRYNLRVGMTRSVQAVDGENGGTKQIPALTVHAAWWDESAIGEVAHYAMISVDRGVVTDIYRRDLSDFVNRANLRSFDLNENEREILRHPIVFESQEHDTIDIVFGDLTTNTIHRLTLKPVLDTRIRIPIGIRDTSYPAPRRQMTGDSRVGAIATSPDQLVYYFTTGSEIKYLRFENGVWASEKSITLSSEVSAEAAIAALGRLVRGD
jgi:hypothetical protein